MIKIVEMDKKVTYAQQMEEDTGSIRDMSSLKA
jgi:hypothetical protein